MYDHKARLDGGQPDHARLSAQDSNRQLSRGQQGCTNSTPANPLDCGCKILDSIPRGLVPTRKRSDRISKGVWLAVQVVNV